MSVANKVLMFRWFEEVWNKGNESAIDDLMAEDVVVYGLGGAPAEPVQGRAEFKKFWRMMTLSLNPIRIQVESVIAEDDKVAARCSVRAVHSGDGLGIAPSGKEVHFTGMVFATFAAEKITEGWNNFDFLSLYQQIGAINAEMR